MTDPKTRMLSLPHIVCAACRLGDFIAIGPRHFDPTMHKQTEAFYATPSAPERDYSAWEQGFIDQHGKFWSRTQAMQIVKDNGQPFNIKRNGEQDQELYSEGLY